MTDVTFILRDGARRIIDVAVGTSVMQAAVMENIKGIDGECGGCLSCATCHVYVESLAAGDLPAKDPDEESLLEGVAAELRPESRLACQIVMTPALVGLVVRVPERQV